MDQIWTCPDSLDMSKAQNTPNSRDDATQRMYSPSTHSVALTRGVTALLVPAQNRNTKRVLLSPSPSPS
jgi:hypothetical protein